MTLARLFAGGCLVCLTLTSYADAKSDYETGLKLYNDGDVVGAMEPLRKAADAGNADAQAFYAFVLTASQFEEQALDYYRKSAAQNNLEGMYGLAGKLAAGEGTPKDLPGARKLYEQASSMGHLPSTIAIAAAYMTGGLGLTDEERTSPAAAEAIKKAGQGGHLQSALMMAKAYQDGLYGVTPDKGEAKKWADIANTIAGKKLDEKKKRRR